MVTNAKRIANKKYRDEKRDQLAVDIPKGKREIYKAKAAELGLSLSLLIQRSVESYGNDENGAPVASKLPAQNSADRLSSDQKKFVDEFSKLPVDAQKHFLKAFQALNNLQKCPSNAPDKPTIND